MSLLMEALRKAEEAKRRGQEQQSSSQGSGTSASANEPPASGYAPAFTLEHREIHTPTLETPLQEPEKGNEKGHERGQERVQQKAPINRDELLDYLSNNPDLEDSSPQVRRRTARGSEPTRDQLAAASVFAAKQQNSGKRKTYIKILTGSLALIVPLVGGTLWYLRDFTASSLTVNPTIVSYDLSSKGFLDEQASAAAATEADETTVELDDYANNILALENTEDPAAPAAALADPAAAVESIPETAVINDTTSIDAFVTATPETIADLSDTGADTATAIASPTDPAATNSTPPPARLQISRSTGRTQVNATLQSAYNTLQAGDYQTAALLYQEVLTEQPNSRDALLGLATIHIRQNEVSQARQLYARILTLNPQDPYARTGLLQTMQSGPGTAQETELKSLLTQYPELAPLHFTLGNLYAAQQRWSEAQTAYFNALVYAGKTKSGPISPDYAFNLAVSLEQLQQPKAALDYYRQAQELALRSPPGFDERLLESRLDLLSLEQNQP